MIKSNKKMDNFYVLYNPLNRKHKIGRTINIKNRLRNLQTQSGIPEIELLYCFPKSGDYEKYFKAIFDFIPHCGEWYEDHHLFWLFKNTLFDFEYKNYSFEDIIIHFSILKNNFLETKEFNKLLDFEDIKMITMPLYNSGIVSYNKIKVERKGIGWGVQKSFLDFMAYRKIKFKNFKYLIYTNDKKTYSINVLPIYREIDANKKALLIETLKMKRNRSISEEKKVFFQKKIDNLYKFD